MQNMSHEIKTPAQGVIGIIDPLIQMYDDMKKTDIKPYLNKISANANRLKKIVETILNHMNLENGKIKVHKKMVELTNLLKRVISDKKLETGAELSFVNKMEKAARINTDPDLLEVALSELINNAIKFNKGKDIKLKLDRLENQISISVEDTGAGVKPGEETRIFEPYFEGTKTRKSSGGSGLGLSIVKEISELIGARIHAKNIKQSKGFGVFLSFGTDGSR